MLRSRWTAHLSLSFNARRHGLALLALAAVTMLSWVVTVGLLSYCALYAASGLPLYLALIGVLLLLFESAALAGLLARRIQRRREPEQPEGMVRDQLTGLHTRRYFYERLDEELQQAQRYGRNFAVLLLDVDGLRGVNEACGEEGGDDVLRILAWAMRAGLRAGDVAARLESDGFAVLLHESREAEAATTAGRISHAAVRRIGATLEGRHAYPVSLSYGVAAYQLDTRGSEFLMRAADRALYAMKREKRRQAWRPQS